MMLNGAKARKVPQTILQVVPSLTTGGAERTTLDIAAALTKRGHRALVATEGGALECELAQVGGTLRPFPAATKNPASILANAHRLHSLIRRENVALVHARSRAPAWSAWVATRRAGIPFVTTYHGIYGQAFPFKGLYNSVMARGDIVIANSKRTAEIIKARHNVDEARLVVIYRGIDLGMFEPYRIDRSRVDGFRAAWGACSGETLILQLARLASWKGQEVTIAALKVLARRGNNMLRLVLAGDAQSRYNYAARLAVAAAESGLGDRVVIPGRVDTADVPAAMAAADIVVVSSIGEEAFGRAAVEAQAAGRPVIATGHGAIIETVLAPPDASAAQRTGWRVAPGDTEALANALTEALALSREDRQALGARARANAKRFSLEQMTSATLAVYGQLLGREL